MTIAALQLDATTCDFKLSHISSNPEFLEFAIENYSEMFGYINTGRVNIRTHRDIEGPPKSRR